MMRGLAVAAPRPSHGIETQIKNTDIEDVSQLGVELLRAAGFRVGSTAADSSKSRPSRDVDRRAGSADSRPSRPHSGTGRFDPMLPAVRSQARANFTRSSFACCPLVDHRLGRVAVVCDFCTAATPPRLHAPVRTGCSGNSRDGMPINSDERRRCCRATQEGATGSAVRRSGWAGNTLTHRPGAPAAATA